MASLGGKRVWKEELERCLFRHSLTISAPQNVEELDQLLQKDIENETDTVMIIGGDGTTNLILQKLAGTPIKLMTIPAGTANDLAWELGLGKGLNNFAQSFQNNSTSLIDLIEINSKLMATDGGLGLPQEVAENVNLFRAKYPLFKFFMRVARSHIYALVAIKQLITKRNDQLELLLESDHINQGRMIVKTPIILINNQQTLGRMFVVAPFTKNNDGKFNVTILTHKNIIKLIWAIIKIRLGHFPKDDSAIIFFETDKLKITNLKLGNLKFLGDGETLTEDKVFDISVSQKKINFYCFNKKTISDNYQSLSTIEEI